MSTIRRTVGNDIHERVIVALIALIAMNVAAMETNPTFPYLYGRSADGLSVTEE